MIEDMPAKLRFAMLDFITTYEVQLKRECRLNYLAIDKTKYKFVKDFVISHLL